MDFVYYLKELSEKEQLEELRQFFCDMFDWQRPQTDLEEIYIRLENELNMATNDFLRKKNNG